MSKHETTPHMLRCLPVGYGNMIMTHRIIGIFNADSSPMKRLRLESKETGRLLDLTEGRRTRSILVLDTNHVVLSALQVETLVARAMESSLMEWDGGDEERSEEHSV